MNIREIERSRSYLHKTAWVYLGQQELWTEFGSQFCHEPHLNYTLDKPLNQLFNKLFIIDQSYFWSFLNKKNSSHILKLYLIEIKLDLNLFLSECFFKLWPLVVVGELEQCYHHCPWSSPHRPFTEQLVLSSPTTNYTVFSESYRWKGSVTHN